MCNSVNLEAHCYVNVNGVNKLFVGEADETKGYQASMISVVLPLDKGEQVTIDPYFDGPLIGNEEVLRTWFSATLLYAK